VDEFRAGLKKSVAIAIGYFPVSFSFGVLCRHSGLPLGLATMISVTNFTSSGQFAGVNLMLAQATYFEVALTLLMINARYVLMSLSLSQKIDQRMTTWQRMLTSFCISDETFALASLETKPITFPWLFGFMLGPFLGWTSGTLCGECVVSLLPTSVQNAMGIALYGMFLAIIIPASRESKSVLCVVITASLLHCALTALPLFAFLSTGVKLIIATLAGAVLGAKLFPRSDEEEGAV